MIKFSKTFEDDIKKALRIRKCHYHIEAVGGEIDLIKFRNEERFCQKVASKMLQLKFKEN